MNIIAHTYDKLTYFGDDKRRLLLNLVSSGVSNADGYTKGAIAKMLQQVDDLTSDFEKETILKCVEELALFNNTPVIFRVNRGEDFAFEVDLEEGESFDGYYLRVYNAEDGVALGPQVAGTDADLQEAEVVDIELPEGHTYRVHVVLEGSTVGEANVLLTEAFLIVGDSIDHG